MLDGENPSMSEKKSPKMKILLAEDDSAMRRFLEISLQRAGFEVKSAEDGLAAMQISLNEKFDAVVTDAVMPNLSGHDLCRILRKDENFKDVPIIILSGLGQETANDGNSEGANLYLLKGANLKDELVEKLNSFIGAVL